MQSGGVRRNDGTVDHPVQYAPRGNYSAPIQYHGEASQGMPHPEPNGPLVYNQRLMIPMSTMSFHSQPMLQHCGGDDQSQSYSYHSTMSQQHHPVVHVGNPHNINGMNYQPPSAMDDPTVISELTDVKMLPMVASQHTHYHHSPPSSISVVQNERSALSPTISSSNGLNMECLEKTRLPKGAQRNKRSISTRSLSFAESNDVDATVHETTTFSESAKSIINDEARQATSKELSSLDDLNVDDPVAMRSFLMRPCPKGVGMVHCYVQRNKGIKNKLFPEYRVYLKGNNAFLMTSKKRAGNKTSNYLISMGRNDHDNRLSPNILGKLRSNFLGTEYMIYDGGKNPSYEESYYEDEGNGDVRCELGAIFYGSTTTLGAKGPRNMKTCISKVDADGKPVRVWQPMNKNDDRMADCYKNQEPSQIGKLMSLVNNPPSWNEEVRAFVLNFNGRVTMASIKNFQMVEESNPDEILLQFGRTGKDTFSLDVQWPLSPFQAFSLALSSFDSKLGCD